MAILPTTQRTVLSPTEEHIFQGWAKANGVDNHDDPKNQFDHRAIFKHGNGMIHPPGMVNKLSQAHNDHMQAQQDAAENHQNDVKQIMTDHVKAQDTAAQNQMDIVKAQHTLKQLLIKRQLGI